MLLTPLRPRRPHRPRCPLPHPPTCRHAPLRLHAVPTRWGYRSSRRPRHSPAVDEDTTTSRRPSAAGGSHGQKRRPPRVRVPNPPSRAEICPARRRRSWRSQPLQKGTTTSRAALLRAYVKPWHRANSSPRTPPIRCAPGGSLMAVFFVRAPLVKCAETRGACMLQTWI